MAFEADTVIIAVIVSVIAPSILAVGTARISSSKQKAQWERDDALEKRRILREEEVARKVQEAVDTNNARLQAIEDTSKVIHALVNTDLTQAYQRDLVSLLDAQSSLQKVIDITMERGGAIEPHDRDEMALKVIRISELRKIIKARLAHQDVIDTQSAQVGTEAAT